MNLKYLTLHMNLRQIPSTAHHTPLQRPLVRAMYFNLFTDVGKTYRNDGNDISPPRVLRRLLLVLFRPVPQLTQRR